jgi:hypothetical protein
VRDAAGNLLDGDRTGGPGGDSVSRFAVFSGQSVNFTDSDGDQVTITVENGGGVDGIQPIGGPATQLTQFWITDPISLVSRVSANVVPGPVGNGILVIAEIIGLDKKDFAPLTANPAVQINRLTFSSNATGRV